MPASFPSLENLMDASAARLRAAAADQSCTERSFAQQMLSTTGGSYRQWESEYRLTMQAVVRAPSPERRAYVVRSACFRFIHQTALFEYLRDNRVKGPERRALFAVIRGDHDYVRAVLTEHGIYTRAAVSLLCARHIGDTVLHDRAMFDPLDRYQERHAEYFAAFCRSETDAQAGDSIRTLVPYLKQKLNGMRSAILKMQTTGAASSQRTADLRRG